MHFVSLLKFGYFVPPLLLDPALATITVKVGLKVGHGMIFSPIVAVTPETIYLPTVENDI
jgi:hypothetical protein